MDPTRSAPQRRPPHRVWYAVGTALLVLAVGFGVTVLVVLLRGFFATDVRVPVDAETHRVEVPTDRDRMLWVHEFETTPTGTIVDVEERLPVRLRMPGAELRRSAGSAGDEVGAHVFDPGSGHLEVRCTGVRSTPPSSVAIGPAPSLGLFVGGIFAAILVPLFLGALGLLVLIVTAVLRSRRRA